MIKIESYGNLWDWGDKVTGDQVSLDVTDYGTYTLGADALVDCEDINALGNALYIDTNLTILPADYTLCQRRLR